MQRNWRGIHGGMNSSCNRCESHCCTEKRAGNRWLASIRAVNRSFPITLPDGRTRTTGDDLTECERRKVGKGGRRVKEREGCFSAPCVLNATTRVRDGGLKSYNRVLAFKRKTRRNERADETDIVRRERVQMVTDVAEVRIACTCRCNGKAEGSSTRKQVKRTEPKTERKSSG